MTPAEITARVEQIDQEYKRLIAAHGVPMTNRDVVAAMNELVNQLPGGHPAVDRAIAHYRRHERLLAEVEIPASREARQLHHGNDAALRMLFLRELADELSAEAVT